MEILWNNTDRGKTTALGEQPVAVPVCHQKSQRDYSKTLRCTRAIKRISTSRNDLM
jgi:hypothetical protein